MDIQEVARLAKVSTATVSRVLNDSPVVKPSTFQRVKRIIEELNYVPNTNARSLRLGRTQLFGLIVSDINNPFFPELIDDFEARARERDIDVIFTHTNYQPDRLEQCVKRLIERNVDGIAICTSETSAEALSFAKVRNKHFVLMNQEGYDTPYSNIHVDHRSGALEAVQHLYKLGHRRIGYISGPTRFASTQERHEAFLEAMKACKLEVQNKWVVEGDLHLEGGQLATAQILKSKPRPTALLCTNDLMAFGALRTAHQQGLSVPEDISIIGVDNLPACDIVTPPLSSINIPRREIASNAFRMLMKQVETKSFRKLPTPEIKTALVLRGSTGRPPK